MKTTLHTIVSAAAAVLLFSPFAVAWTDCDPCAPITCDPCAAVGCKPKESLWDFGGWIDAGIYANEYGQENDYASTFSQTWSGNTAFLQNVRQSDFQMNQLWVYGQKKLSKRGFSVGGRVDLAYGTDAVYLQSANLEYNYENANDRWNTGDYYTALPQLYGEVGYNSLSVKVGKFLPGMQYDSLMSSENFFYSWAWSVSAMPYTLTGAVATWDYSKNLSVFGGWVSGENKTFEDEDDNAFYGGVEWKPGKRLAVRYSVLVGTQKYRNGTNDRDYFVQSLVADVKLNKRWNYAFEWTLRNETRDYGAGDRYAGSYGINNELFYKLNKKWTLGARLEWMHGYSDGVRHTYPNMYLIIPPYAYSSDDMISFTLALNWKPNKWLTVRPELRYDVWDTAEPFNGDSNNYASNSDWKDNQLSGGVSLVVNF